MAWTNDMRLVVGQRLRQSLATGLAVAGISGAANATAAGFENRADHAIETTGGRLTSKRPVRLTAAANAISVQHSEFRATILSSTTRVKIDVHRAKANGNSFNRSRQVSRCPLRGPFRGMAPSPLMRPLSTNPGL